MKLSEEEKEACLRPSIFNNRGGKRENTGRKAKIYPQRTMQKKVPEKIYLECVQIVNERIKLFEKTLCNQK